MNTTVHRSAPVSKKLAVNAITALGLLCSALSCILLAGGEQPVAFALVITAMILDMVDGPLARKAGVTSRLGSWLDSCSDVFVYLFFPALYWANAYSLPVWVLVIFVGAGLFRLLRFTLIGFGEDDGKLFYAGMPVFYSQLLLVATLVFSFELLLLSTVLVAISALMVSTLPFTKIPVRVLAVALVIYVALVALELSHVL